MRYITYVAPSYKTMFLFQTRKSHSQYKLEFHTLIQCSISNHICAYFHIMSIQSIHLSHDLLTVKDYFGSEEVMCNQDYEETKVYIHGSVNDVKRTHGGG